MITLIIREILKRYKEQFEFLSVGQKATITRIWRVGLLGMRFHVGLFVERAE